jgi:hypothetical protein
MKDPTIEALRTEFVLEARVQCDAARVIGNGKHGRRVVIPIVGGTFEGPRIRGEVLPGGADWQVFRADGIMELEALYTLRADDGALVSVRNRGLTCLRPEALSAADLPGPYVRTVPEFEAATDGPHAWLNRWLFVGTLQVLSFDPLLVQVRFFRVL